MGQCGSPPMQTGMEVILQPMAVPHLQGDKANPQESRDSPSSSRVVERRGEDGRADSSPDLDPTEATSWGWSFPQRPTQPTRYREPCLLPACCTACTSSTLPSTKHQTRAGEAGWLLQRFGSSHMLSSAAQFKNAHTNTAP